MFLRNIQVSYSTIISSIYYNKSFKNNCLQIMDISLLRGLQLVLDQFPAGAGFKKSHRVEELVKLQSQTAESHLWKPNIAAQIMVATSVMFQGVCDASEFLSRTRKGLGHSNEDWVWELGLYVKSGTCWYGPQAKDLGAHGDTNDYIWGKAGVEQQKIQGNIYQRAQADRHVGSTQKGCWGSLESLEGTWRFRAMILSGMLKMLLKDPNLFRHKMK